MLIILLKCWGWPDEVDEDMDQEELNVLLGKPTSRSGDGLEKGSGNGTSDEVADNDNSTIEPRQQWIEIKEKYNNGEVVTLDKQVVQHPSFDASGIS